MGIHLDHPRASEAAILQDAANDAHPRERANSAMTQALYHSHADHDEDEKSHVNRADLNKEDCDLVVPHRKRLLCWSLTKKKWIYALVASVVAIVGVVLLVIFLAVIPAMFQKYADQVGMDVNYMDIKSLSIDPASNVVEMEMSIRVSYDSSVSSSMDDARATLYYEDQSFGVVTLPAQKFPKGKDSFDLVIRDKAEIADAAVFRKLSKALVTDAQVSINTRAQVKAHAMGLSYGGLTLDRTFTIKAFEEFQEPAPQVNSIALSECNKNDYKMLINITLDNDSQVGIGGIGALNMSVYYEQSYLGQAVSTNASLGIPRGSTSMEMEITIQKDASVMAAMLGMVGGLLANKVQFYITGNHPYATQAVLLDEAFAALNISILYTDGLSKVTLNPKCDLMAILSGGR